MKIICFAQLNLGPTVLIIFEPKGQLILKCPFGIFKSFSKISALASKKGSNKKIRALLYC